MLTLSDTEVATVRSLTGVATSESDLTDNLIRSVTLLGKASTFVFQRITENVNVSTLATAISPPISRVPANTFNDYRDEHYSSVDTIRNVPIDHFVEEALSTQQQLAFREAVMYRTAGLAMTVLKPALIEESTSQIRTQRRSEKDWQVVQKALFSAAKEAIDLIFDIYSDDAFQKPNNRLFLLV